ncbi:c-type cytochrome [Aquimarina sediminis]|uniref:c-type cytochrome n=1 Tax=Aquimarina sediminis TaxID=2070536 RepID=UPI000CA08864|nr:cytochrome c [Aquimarina sediminis]
MKSTIKILAAAVVMICVVSCQKKSKPNYQYMPNMYESVGYETYGEYGIFPGGQEAMLPVDGSIPRGWMPYEYENSQKGYLLAKDTLKNPILYTKENEEEGKELYDIYCAICHGGKGDGKGPLVKREKILGVPSYDDIGRAITEGSIYHVMYYGINSMGSYAAQTNEHERWQIVQYVQKLKADLEGKTPRIDAAITTTNTEEVKAEVVEEHPEKKEDHSNAH